MKLWGFDTPIFAVIENIGEAPVSFGEQPAGKIMLVMLTTTSNIFSRLMLSLAKHYNPKFLVSSPGLKAMGNIRIN